ncbi:MAG: proline--tRNA ligase, partial [Kiritimatiellae bacterium]|nr:proline--tRNA ligase [Kiritimatiellia bacterium]
MKWSKMMIQTLREDPGDAEIDSHKLLVRAALVKKTAAGLFTFLPLGMRALRKVEAIVREEMNRAGAQELLMPILQPAELWQTTGRWETMGANMFKLKDRAQHDFALGPTAEEEVTDVVKSVVSSYRQLPVIVYQIQTKFRDETRPRFGLMRSKEFIMKDAYSFDVDAAGADESYWNMYHAYERIFARCGLKATPVQADGGDMGDSMTHEFHALADAGEDGIASCPACGYAANLERAERKIAGGRASSRADTCPPAEAVPTPNARTIEEVAAFFGLPPSAFVKTLVYVADGKPVMVCVPGDRDVNEVKLKRFLKAKAVALADARTVEEVTGAPVGFAGPVKPAQADVPVYAEAALEGASGVVVGANQADTHLKNVDLARDAQITAYADLVICGAGDLCPKCGQPMELKRGIEVGQVFKLGTKYTDAFKAVYKNDQLKENVMIMGCYGVGVSRTMQAVVEQSHDKDGIIWPASV